MRLVDVDFFAVLASPRDGGLRGAGGAADEGHVGRLLHHHVPGALAIDDVGRH